ncbi:MAG TPA: hypothetical protein VF338_08190 [Leptolinea sp.]
MVDTELIKHSMERFKIMEKIEKYEAGLETIETRWEKLNAIRQMALELEINPEEDQDIAIVRERWISLKREYASY